MGTSPPPLPLCSVFADEVPQGDVDVIVIVVVYFGDNVENAALACTILPRRGVLPAVVCPERARAAARVVELLAVRGRERPLIVEDLVAKA